MVFEIELVIHMKYQELVTRSDLYVLIMQLQSIQWQCCISIWGRYVYEFCFADIWFHWILLAPFCNCISVLLKIILHICNAFAISYFSNIYNQIMALFHDDVIDDAI